MAKIPDLQSTNVLDKSDEIILRQDNIDKRIRLDLSDKLSWCKQNEKQYKGEYRSGVLLTEGDVLFHEGVAWEAVSTPYTTLDGVPTGSNDSSNVKKSRITKEDLVTVREDLLAPGTKLYMGDDGESVKVGDTVPAGTTHLRAEIGGRPELVAMSPTASGTVTELNGFEAIIGAVSVKLAINREVSFSSVEQIKSSSYLSALIDVQDVSAKTTAYYSGYNVLTRAPSGSAEYTLTTKQRVRDAKGNPLWEPNGTGDHYLFEGNQYVAVIKSDVANVQQYGATGGNSTVDTPAFVSAMNSQLPVEVPPVDFDNAYVISGEVEIPKQSVMYGTTTLKAPVTDDDARLTRQAYITFEDVDSRFWGGSGSNDRSGMYWSDLMFISSAGSRAKVGTAIGRKSGNTESAMGGNCNRIAFAGFADAWINDWAYFLDITGLDLLENNRGLTFNDWNSSSISTVYGRGGGDYYIDTGEDSSRSTFRDIGLNMNSSVKIGIRFEGGVTFSGYVYFEGFGTPDVADQTCIAAAISRFNYQRPVGLENILFAAPEAAYSLTIGGIEDLGDILWSGVIAKCRFYETQIAPIGFGIHARYNGNPTFPNASISGLDLNTCVGVEKSDLVGTPYQRNPTTLNAFMRRSFSFTPSTWEWERLPISNDDIVSSNQPNLIDASNRVIIDNIKTYEVECILRLKNESSTEFLPQAALMYNGVAQDSCLELVPPKSANNVYKTIVLSAVIENTSTSGQIYIQARNSCEIISYSLRIKQLYSEI